MFPFGNKEIRIPIRLSPDLSRFGFNKDRNLIEGFVFVAEERVACGIFTDNGFVNEPDVFTNFKYFYNIRPKCETRFPANSTTDSCAVILNCGAWVKYCNAIIMSEPQVAVHRFKNRPYPVNTKSTIGTINNRIESCVVVLDLTTLVSEP